MAKPTLESIRPELAAVAAGHGCELLDLEFRGGTLRLVLDRHDGVTIEHCAEVSREASAVLDALEFGGGRYTLEVSSPGLDRPLRRDEEWTRFTGSLARLTYRDADGKKQSRIARIVGFDPEARVATLRDESRRNEELQISLADIDKARLEVEI